MAFTLFSFQFLLQQIHLRSAHAHLLLLKFLAVTGGVVHLFASFGIRALDGLEEGNRFQFLGDKCRACHAFAFERMLVTNTREIIRILPSGDKRNNQSIVLIALNTRKIYVLNTIEICEIIVKQ